MHIDIVIGDLTTLMSCNDTVTVLKKDDDESEHSLHHKQNIIFMQGVVTEFAEIERIVEKFKNNQCKTLLIPYSNIPLDKNPAFSLDFVMAFVNHEEFDKILVNPDGYFLERIIIKVDKGENKEMVRCLLSVKVAWSKARKLSFILDALDINLIQSEVCDRHYMKPNEYAKHLKQFCIDCENELLNRAENIFVANQLKKQENTELKEKDLRDIFNIIKKLNETHKLYLKFCEEKNPYGDRLLKRVMESEYIIIDWIRHNISLMTKIQFYDPLFCYIKHLIRKEYLTTSIKKEYKEQLNIINKINSLKKYSLPFPIDLLKEFWGESIWEEIINGTTGRQLVIEMLAEHYGQSESAITRVIHRKTTS